MQDGLRIFMAILIFLTFFKHYSKKIQEWDDLFPKFSYYYFIL